MSVYSWPELTKSLIAGIDLTTDQTSWAMNSVMAGESSPVQLAGFLVALRSKGETVAEVLGLADAMLSNAIRFEHGGPSVDIVGTGGDGAHTVNISTMSALVLAGAGLTVIKHGNRAASSKSGSADVLEALGINLDHDPEVVAQLAESAGITFCFASKFHPAMRHAAAARSGLAIPTVFNFLGPLTNPAQPASMAVGVADLRMAPLIAGVFANRGTNALVFRNNDGLDELAATASAEIWEVRDGIVTENTIDAAKDLGLPSIDISELRGGSAIENAQVALDLLSGKPGAVRETVLLNSAAALVADASLPGLSVGTLAERLLVGMEIAAEAIDSGAASEKLSLWKNR